MNAHQESTEAAPLVSPARSAHIFAAQMQEMERSVTLTDGQARALYSQAYQLTERGRFEEANVALALLMIYRHDDPKYTLASAYCFRKCGSYEDSIAMLVRTLELAPEDPGPAFLMAECMALLGRRDAAASVLEQVAEVARSQGDQDVLERATALLEFQKASVQ